MSETHRCGHCGATFSTIEAAAEHADICAGGEDNNGGGSGNPNGAIYECSQCGAIFGTARACNDHRKHCSG